eukprot:scaffold4481_cov121-Cylindrotheca_fusiformis.AAC.5
MVAFTWAITTALNLFAFVTATVLLIQIETHYARLERYYESDDWLNNYRYNHNNGDDAEEGGDGDENRLYEEAQQIQAQHLLLSTTSTHSIAWVAFYVMLLSTGLVLYGSTAIIGFTSLRGVYIAPCFSSGSDKLRLGIFGGAVVFFANLLLVCAVILGEVRVDDNQERGGGDENNNKNNGDDMEQYRVERIAAVLAVTCMFLSALYTIFAVLLFLCYAGDYGSTEQLSDGEGRPGNKTPLVNDGQVPALANPGFITIDNSN